MPYLKPQSTPKSEARSMAHKPNVVIIGGGVAGLSAAMHCARLGADSVTVLERTELAAGSSALSAGIFNQQTADPFDQEMRAASIAVLSDLETRELLTLHRCGYLRLARSADQWKRARQTFAILPEGRSRLLTPSEVADLVPGMRTDDVHGGMFGPDDGHMDGTQLCQAYLAMARADGAKLRRRAKVIGVTRDGHRRTVHTDSGSFRADLIINAAGPWIDTVGETIGCPVPVVNQPHQIAIINAPSLTDHPIPTVQTYFPGSGGDAVYVRPEGPGQFIGGLHSYESQGDSADPDNYKNSVEDAYLEELAQHLLDRFPGWEDASLRPGWTGLYPLSPDGRFIIGPHPDDDHVIILGGLGGVGLTVSGSVGALAAEWALLDGPQSISEETACSYLPSRLAVPS